MTSEIFKLLGTALLLTFTLTASGDVLYKYSKAIAVGKGKVDKHIIHWTYCDGKEQDFKRPPHEVAYGEHCKIQGSYFGLKNVGGVYVVEDEDKFGKFFAGASQGDKVEFSTEQSINNTETQSINMRYKGETLKLQYAGGDLQNHPQ